MGEINLKLLNALASPPDPRDIPFVPKILPENFKSSIDLMPDVYEVEDQLDVGACVTNGTLAQCEMLAKRNGRPIDLSRMFLYTATLDYEGRLGEEGLYVRDAYKVASKYGVCTEEAYPYDPTKRAVRPPDDMYALAYNTRVLRYEVVISSIGFSVTHEQKDRINKIKSALNEGLPVGIGMSVSKSIFTMTGPWRDQSYMMLATSGSEYDANIAGGHYMVIIGYDDAANKFLVQNSWGPGWGDGGFAGFDYSVVSEPWFEAWIVRNFDGNQVPEQPGIYFEGVNKFRLEARIVAKPEEIGKPTNIWMACRDPKSGTILLRNPIPTSMVSTDTTDFSGAQDVWSPFDGVNLIPTATDYFLTDDNKIRVVHWKNLEGYEGIEVYMAYGNSPLDWTVVKLCTIPAV